MCEFGRMNIQRIDSHTTRCTGQPPTVPLHPVIPCFLGTEHQDGVSCPLVVSKRYHICDTKCIFQWYLKKYHICGTKTSIVVSKDTTYVVSFADVSKKDCFQTVLFLFFWVHQHDKNKCRNGHLSDLFWQHCYSSEWQWMGFLGGTCSP